MSGQHHNGQWLRENAKETATGERRVTVALNAGDSVENLASTKGKRIFGPASVEVIYWLDGGINQYVHDLPATENSGGKA